MAEVFEKCPACNADLRQNAVFCYRCGRPLTAEAEAAAKNVETQNLNGDAGMIAEAQIAPAKKTEYSETLIAPAKPAPATQTVETLSETSASSDEQVNGLAAAVAAPPTAENHLQANPENTANEVKPLIPVVKKTGKARRFVNQTEYVWEEAEAPTPRLVLFAVLAFAFVLMLVWLSNFWRY